MLKRIGWVLFFALILGTWFWGFAQWREAQVRLAALEENIAGIGQAVGGVSVPTGSQQASYEVTVDMWQIFEKELRDYKQRLREGKRQYEQQQSGWNRLLTELKKTLQEYDKFIAAEGEFWEKQLRSYDKLLAKNEARFEQLDQAIAQLDELILDFQQWSETREVELKSEIKEAEVLEEEEEVYLQKPTRIEPRIKSRRKYDTYPRPSEEEQMPVEERGEVIRGTVTGSGEYETY